MRRKPFSNCECVLATAMSSSIVCGVYNLVLKCVVCGKNRNLVLFAVNTEILCCLSRV